jgi:hypothetical protein
LQADILQTYSPQDDDVGEAAAVERAGDDTEDWILECL